MVLYFLDSIPRKIEVLNKLGFLFLRKTPKSPICLSMNSHTFFLLVPLIKPHLNLIKKRVILE